MKIISVIGAGALGKAVINRLLDKGLNVSAYNRTKSKLLQGITGNLTIIESLDNAFTPQNNIWILCLTDEDAILSTLNTKEVKQQLELSRFTFINMSTIGVSASDRIQSFFGEFDISYVETPVSGGPEGALSGSLIAYVGNRPTRYYKEYLLILETLCCKYSFMETNAAAQTMKIINNYCEAVNLAVAAEALVLAEKSGMTKELISQSFSLGRGSSIYLELLLERYLRDAQDISVPLNIRIKDLTLSKRLFDTLCVESNFFEKTLNIYVNTQIFIGEARDQCSCFEYLKTGN